MTKDEFIQRYARNSRLSVEQLSVMGLIAKPCVCGDESCVGWRMTFDRLRWLEENHPELCVDREPEVTDGQD